jgi:hypothetical protein
MSGPNKIQYEHLEDYPTSTEGYRKIGNRAVAAALYCEHMPDIAEASPERKPRTAIAMKTLDPASIRKWRDA